MGEGSAPWLACAACGGAIGVYERCLVVRSGEPVEISWLSFAEDEREAAGEARRVCRGRFLAAGRALASEQHRVDEP